MENISAREHPRGCIDGLARPYIHKASPYGTWAARTLHWVTRAIEYYEKGLTIARQIGDRRSEGNALFNMSLALDQLGERALAIASA
jgi:hypothetical protein